MKTLFRLLRLLNVPQTAVCQQLHVAEPMVSAWATGTRPLPPRYHRRFFAFVAHRLDEALAQQHARQAAMARIVAADGAKVPWDEFTPEEQEALRREPGTEEDEIDMRLAVGDAILRLKFPDPSPPSLAEQVIQLLDEWWLATQHVEVYRELWGQCRRVGAYGEQDFEAFWRRVSSSPRERIALQRAADMLVTQVRRLERIVVPLGAESLLVRREAWRALVAHPRARTEPREPG